jgi:hypothetical protein
MLEINQEALAIFLKLLAGITETGVLPLSMMMT